MKQIEYITCIDEILFFLNVNTISKKTLANIQNEKYTHVLTSLELTFNNKFQIIMINSAFKK